jgi:hypothetical protein
MKAQFEAMGLAVIVILISLGMVFLLLFSSDEKSQAPQQYEEQQTAQSVIDAMLQTNIEDCDLNVAEIIEDAMIRNRNPCGDSYQVLDNAAGIMLNDTLEKRGVYYNFTVQEEGNDIFYSKGNCDAVRSDHFAPGVQTLSLYPTTKVAKVTLTLCR